MKKAFKCMALLLLSVFITLTMFGVDVKADEADEPIVSEENGGNNDTEETLTDTDYVDETSNDAKSDINEQNEVNILDVEEEWGIESEDQLEGRYLVMFDKGDHGRGYEEISIDKNGDIAKEYREEEGIYVAIGSNVWQYPYAVGDDGYVFIGWKTEGDDTLYLRGELEDTITEKYITNYVPQKDTVFIAQWAEGCTVTAKSGNHGKGFERRVLYPDEQEYRIGYEKQIELQHKKGETCFLWEQPVADDGYAFIGWKAEGDDNLYLDEYGFKDTENKKYIYNYKVTKDIVFTAQWAEGYKISLVSDIGYINGDQCQKEWQLSVRKGSTLSAQGNYVNVPYMSCPDKAFIGWELESTGEVYYDNPDKGQNSIYDYIPSGDVTFIAKWSDDVYKIKFDANGGNWVSDELSGKSFVISKKERLGIGPDAMNISRDGYALTGYKVKETGEFFSIKSVGMHNYVPSSDITLVAQWKEAYKVTIKTERGYIYTYSGTSYDSPHEVVINVGKGDSMSSENSYYRFSVDDEPGYGIIGYEIEGTGKILETSDSGKKENNIDNFIPTSDVTLIVKWKEAYKITVKYDGADNDMGEEIHFTPKGYPLSYGLSFFFPNADKQKKEFLGFKIAGDKSGKIYNPWREVEGSIYTYTPKSDITLIPAWADAYYVSIDGDGGKHYIGKSGDYFKIDDEPFEYEIDTENWAVEKNTNLVLGDHPYIGVFDEGAIFKKGYDFVGWTVVGKENKIYKFGEPIKIDSDMTIKAVWKKKGEIEKPGVKYSTHVQTYAWQNEVKNGEMSGTVGQSKRLEAIKINLENAPYSGDIEYRTHVQSYGWMNWAKNGNLSGTSGEAKRLEAIQIRLTGEMAKYYDVYYRVQAQTYGWLGWAKNGEYAGTAGFAKRLEAIQILLVEKGSKVTGNTKVDGKTLDKLGNISSATKQTPGSAYIAKQPNISYRTHVQSFGWQSFVSNGAMSGTSGKAKRLEGIEIKLGSLPYAGGVRYTTHVQTYGWQGKENDPTTWKKDGAMAGTSGEAKRLEAIRIGLYGEMAEKYDIYYRVHAQSYGWLGWAKNGNPAGTAGYAKRLEGIQIVLVEKGKPAPGKTYNGITANRNESYISK